MSFRDGPYITINVTHTHTHTHTPRESHSRTRHAEIEGADTFEWTRVTYFSICTNHRRPYPGAWFFAKSITRYLLPHVPAVRRTDRKSDDRHERDTRKKNGDRIRKREIYSYRARTAVKSRVKSPQIYQRE